MVDFASENMASSIFFLSNPAGYQRIGSSGFYQLASGAVKMLPLIFFKL